MTKGGRNNSRAVYQFRVWPQLWIATGKFVTARVYLLMFWVVRYLAPCGYTPQDPGRRDSPGGGHANQMGEYKAKIVAGNRYVWTCTCHMTCLLGYHWPKQVMFQPGLTGQEGLLLSHGITAFHMTLWLSVAVSANHSKRSSLKQPPFYQNQWLCGPRNRAGFSRAILLLPVVWTEAALRYTAGRQSVGSDLMLLKGLGASQGYLDSWALQLATWRLLPLTVQGSYRECPKRQDVGKPRPDTGTLLLLKRVRTKQS